LTVVPAGTGTGTVTSSPAGISCGATCAASFAAGTLVTLTVAPSVTSMFAGWSGAGCTGTGSCAVTLNAAASVTATFTLKQVAVTVTPAGAGTGTVSSSPAGISCGTTCTASFAYGSTVTLTATPTSTSTFAGWSGACSGTSTCVVAPTAATAVTATFDVAAPTPLLRWTLDGNATNTGSVAGYPLTLTGAVTYVTGKAGQAAQFASGAYGMVQGSARAVLGAYAQYTISFWVNATATPNTGNAFFDFNNRSTAPYGGVQLAYSSSTQFSMCVASTTNSYLGGSCGLFSAPATGAWHHVILRYAGTGTSAGQGAGVDVYEDDVLVKTIANDASNNPVFSSGISDSLYIGTGGISLDDVRVYNTTFTVANQCTQIIGGTWNGTSCTLP
jgi:hypothetical protein